MSNTVKQSIIYCSVAAVLGLLTTVYPNELSTSKEGLAFIAKWENCTTTVYTDIVGVCTGGVGSTRGLDGKPLARGGSLTLEEVTRLFMRDVKDAEWCVFRYFDGMNLPQPIFDSVVSLVYNNGCYGTRWNKKANRPTSIQRAATGGDWEKVCYHIGDFINAGGKPSKGLINRRTEEQRMCLLYRKEQPLWRSLN